MDPLLNGVDCLLGLHDNTQIPKIIQLPCLMTSYDNALRIKSFPFPTLPSSSEHRDIATKHLGLDSKWSTLATNLPEEVWIKTEDRFFIHRVSLVENNRG